MLSNEPENFAQNTRDRRRIWHQRGGATELDPKQGAAGDTGDDDVMIQVEPVGAQREVIEDSEVKK